MTTHESIMEKYLELCVQLRKSHIAKEGLYQYINICQQDTRNLCFAHEQENHSRQQVFEKMQPYLFPLKISYCVTYMCDYVYTPLISLSSEWIMERKKMQDLRVYLSSFMLVYPVGKGFVSKLLSDKSSVY